MSAEDYKKEIISMLEEVADIPCLNMIILTNTKWLC